jgi:hypothetical protein
MKIESETDYMHEDDLPEDMTADEYDRWYEQSYVPGGVGCRVGPVVNRSHPDPIDRFCKDLDDDA